MPEFLVPDLGEGLEDATVVAWLVGEGDEVELNQPICVLETAKAEVEVPSPYAGRVTKLGGSEGQTLRVGSLLALIGEDVSPRQPTLVGYGHDASLDKSRRRERHAVADRPATARPLAKPPVRQLARRLGVDLADVSPGSGPDGVVTRADVEAASASGTPATAVGDDGEVIAMRGIRARVAERMAASRATIPDATCSVTVNCSRLLEARSEMKAEAERNGVATPITPFSLLCRFVVLALRNAPVLNASVIDAGPEIRVHPSIHLGIGTATGRGLVVTVVREAQHRGVLDLSMEIARLSEGARAGTLPPGELQGSTFTISNFGSLGLDDGIPIINLPEVAILGVGAIRARPHVVDGTVVACATASLTLAFDHRVCDGAEAGIFLSHLRQLIEHPELALL
jgi:2-oxoisovalerate dehydrogenase E2 component (dihydrolipoyl transacylase)